MWTFIYQKQTAAQSMEYKEVKEQYTQERKYIQERNSVAKKMHCNKNLFAYSHWSMKTTIQSTIMQLILSVFMINQLHFDAQHTFISDKEIMF